MSTARDYLNDLRRYYLPKARVQVSNAWHHAAGRHIQGSRARFANWRNGKAIARGRRDVAARAGDQVRSRTPVLRDRIDRRTGRQNRDAGRLGRQQDVTLGWRQTHRLPLPRGRCPDHGEPGVPLRIRLGERHERRAADRKQRRAGRSR